MSLDYTALAGSVGVGLREVRACLLLSREGSSLGVYPATGVRVDPIPLAREFAGLITAEDEERT